jgi:ABC-2 type transport system permease protein
MMRTIGLLAWRDLLRFGRQRGRLLGAVVAPVVILVFFGAAAESMMRAGDVYRKFLLAGMLVQAMIFSANTSASSLLWDREFGFLKVLTLAPVPPSWVALGKVAGSALQALAHGLVFLLAAPLVGVWLSPLELFSAIGVVALIAVALSALALTVASRTRTYEDFNTLMLLLSIPMLFVSGVHFPVMEFPPWLRTLARLNPATYGIDALKHLFVPATSAGRWVPDFPLGLDLGVLVAFAALCLGVAVLRLRLREE